MGNLNAIFQLINPGNTITANRALAHAIGLTETIVYSALIAKYAYYESREMLYQERWFYCTFIDLQESTTFSRKVQSRAIDHLEQLGLISVMSAGMPAKRYISLSDDVELLRRLIEEGMKRSAAIAEKSRNRLQEYISKRKNKETGDL